MEREHGWLSELVHGPEYEAIAAEIRLRDQRIESLESKLANAKAEMIDEESCALHGRAKQAVSEEPECVTCVCARHREDPSQVWCATHARMCVR